jgi:hypothetical protein
MGVVERGYQKATARLVHPGLNLGCSWLAPGLFLACSWLVPGLVTLQKRFYPPPLGEGSL